MHPHAAGGLFPSLHGQQVHGYSLTKPAYFVGETIDDRLRHRRGNPSPMRGEDGAILENGGSHMAGALSLSFSRLPFNLLR